MLTSCNCSICRRYGALWAYYRAADVRIVSKRGATDSYSWGRKALKFVRCATCGRRGIVVSAFGPDADPETFAHLVNLVTPLGADPPPS